MPSVPLSADGGPLAPDSTPPSARLATVPRATGPFPRAASLLPRRPPARPPVRQGASPRALVARRWLCPPPAGDGVWVAGRGSGGGCGGGQGRRGGHGARGVGERVCGPWCRLPARGGERARVRWGDRGRGIGKGSAPRRLGVGPPGRGPRPSIGRARSCRARSRRGRRGWWRRGERRERGGRWLSPPPPVCARCASAGVMGRPRASPPPARLGAPAHASIRPSLPRRRGRLVPRPGRRACGRASGMRAPAAARGTPRRRPSVARLPSGGAPAAPPAPRRPRPWPLAWLVSPAARSSASPCLPSFLRPSLPPRRDLRSDVATR